MAVSPPGKQREKAEAKARKAEKAAAEKAVAEGAKAQKEAESKPAAKVKGRRA